jgi:hypothetical protein
MSHLAAESELTFKRVESSVRQCGKYTMVGTQLELEHYEVMIVSSC